MATNQGLIFCFEGLDASGKQTQVQKIFNRLKEEGHDVIRISFPHYESEGSALVKMYLDGKIGQDPEKINPYAVSTFYANDRFISFEKEYRKFYENGGIILCDRYTTSNMLFQASKITDLKEKDVYLDWLWDLEFNKFKLPVPDKVLFLDVPPEVSIKLMENRPNKYSGNKKKDIHESNKKFLKSAYDNAMYIVNKYDWHKVRCVKNDILRSIEDIHNDIYGLIKKSIKENDFGNY
ncbi:dTMP kinase [Alkaliphilus sp. B6464]|uniref:dTMP kinase n=1 Tax=Alkaliphilus sp. B6464 TaxID=2731219 RepID=UPI001BA5020B|nr:thymidylate kinase [Alkaliphilus sp. B6464]QUH21882.1 thymidylate kinase [Alkaliphilus sp. B6464]